MSNLHNKPLASVLEGLLLGTSSVACALFASPASALVFSNPMSIAIPNRGDIGLAAPYPSNIVVSGVGTDTTDISASFFGLSHSFPDDIDALLVAPNGGTVRLMSDVGGAADLVNINLTFQDGAPALPNSTLITSGTYRPTNELAADSFPAPAPTGPYGTSLSALRSGSVDGTWSLYIVDDFGRGDFGSIAGGWQITFQTALSTVPEPGTLAMTSLGALILLTSSWRRQRTTGTVR